MPGGNPLPEPFLSGLEKRLAAIKNGVRVGRRIILNMRSTTIVKTVWLRNFEGIGVDPSHIEEKDLSTPVKCANLFTQRPNHCAKCGAPFPWAEKFYEEISSGGFLGVDSFYREEDGKAEI